MAIYFKLVRLDIFPDIMHIKVNHGHMSAILNFSELNFFRAYSSWNHIFGFIVMI